MATTTDVVRGFIEDCFTPCDDPTRWPRPSEVNALWRDRPIKSPFGTTRMKFEMERLGYRQGRRRGSRFWVGIAIRQHPIHNTAITDRKDI